LAAPWEARRAGSWDRTTFAEWLRRNAFTGGSRMLLRLAIRSVFGTEPEDLSLLHVLFYIHSAGGFNPLVNTAGGAQDSRIVGGSQLLAIKSAERLGDAVRLGAPVRRIAETGDGLELHTDAGAVQAQRAIVAVSPTISSRIDVDPP